MYSLRDRRLDAQWSPNYILYGTQCEVSVEDYVPWYHEMILWCQVFVSNNVPNNSIMMNVIGFYCGMKEYSSPFDPLHSRMQFCQQTFLHSSISRSTSRNIIALPARYTTHHFIANRPISGKHIARQTICPQHTVIAHRWYTSPFKLNNQFEEFYSSPLWQMHRDASRWNFYLSLQNDNEQLDSKVSPELPKQILRVVWWWIALSSLTKPVLA